MSDDVKLPEAIERDLTLTHSEICDCENYGDRRRPEVGRNCIEVRNMLRRAIAAALLVERQVALRQAKTACEELALIDRDKVNAAALACANRIRTLCVQADALEKETT